MEFTIIFSDDGAALAFSPVRFDVEAGFIRYDTLNRSVSGFQEVYRGVDIALLGSGVDFDIVIAHVEHGSLLVRLGRRLAWPAAIAGGLIIQDGTSGFVQGLTGKEVEEWASIAGEEVRRFISSDAEDHDYERLRRQVEASIITNECARRFMEVSQDEFEEIISERPEAAAAIQEGRRIFYEGLRADEFVPSVGFSRNVELSRIPRSQFSERAVRHHVAEVPTVIAKDEGDWGSEVLEISITSPNWDRQDQQRGWKGKLASGRYIFFEITDTKFWRLVGSGLVQSSPNDTMVAQFVFRNVNNRYKSARAIKIISFNEQHISDPDPAEKIEKLVNDLQVESSQRQDVLFQERP